MQGFLDGIAIVKEIIEGVKWLINFVKENKNEQWFRDSTTTFKQLQGAKTDEEKRKAVSDLAKLIGRLG